VGICICICIDIGKGIGKDCYAVGGVDTVSTLPVRLQLVGVFAGDGREYCIHIHSIR
jgi:hypothetical protein